MERYAGALEEVADGARQQERHYQLLSALQSLVKELPSACPTPRSATWPWRFSTAPCSKSCRGYWRSSTSLKRACTTSACAYRTSTEAVEHRIREEQRAMDRKIVLELDRKVADQQSTLEKAGVAGFYVTTNPQELMLQMNLLELIRKLQQRGCRAGKAALGLGGPWQPPAAQCDQKGSPVPP
ncbi:protein DGCR6 isoform X2 [Theropithecus gelada]|uniref:protein DGCR6 isoform X2 n=1 Tax=Theropithecus gelada TaxID=9565 RepID=UPI000DC15CF4|nr:protein DGCR6 isoform X2 [Theropithecus gelada]